MGANLVLQVLPDGRLMAYSADKGEKLLEMKTGAPSGMGPPMTYMLDGRQYLVVAGDRPVACLRGPLPRATSARAIASSAGRPRRGVATFASSPTTRAF